jgi:hypothetical protein
MPVREFPIHGQLNVVQLGALSMEQLVEIHNAIKPDKPVEKFGSKGKANSIVWLLGTPVPEPTAEVAEQVSPASDADVSSSEAGPTDTGETDMAKAKAKKAAKEKGPKKARKGAVDPSTPLSVLVKENPRRAGSKSHKRWDAYKGARTVGKALENGALAADIQWDVAHGYIKLG